MSAPNFVQRPITVTEKETTILLLKDLTVKQIKELKFLSFQGAQSQTTRIRQKMHASTFNAAVARMVAIGIITKEELMQCLPSGWDEHIMR